MKFFLFWIACLSLPVFSSAQDVYRVSNRHPDKFYAQWKQIRHEIGLAESLYETLHCTEAEDLFVVETLLVDLRGQLISGFDWVLDEYEGGIPESISSYYQFMFTEFIPNTESILDHKGALEAFRTNNSEETSFSKLDLIREMADRQLEHIVKPTAKLESKDSP